MQPGERFADRYEIVRLAGSGGMGSVYEARDLTAERRVALKVAHGVDDDTRARIVREADALRSIRHPAVVPLIDVGERDGAPYLVMDWVEGAPLSRRLAAGPLGVRDTLALAARLADGLAAAHAAGVVHRDLKPDNVLLPEGGPAVAVLVDFGIALPFIGEVARVTDAGALVGTLSYMSPEQARGLREIGPPSDLYSLGVLLHECLTGRRLVDAEDNAMTLLTILMRDAPLAHAPTEPTPRALTNLVDRLLAKHPSARPADAAAVASVLAAVDPDTRDATAPSSALVTQPRREARPTTRPRRDAIERPALLAKIEGALADGARLVTLLGPSGIGKSQLARRFIDAPADREPIDVSLAGLSAPDGLSAVAVRLGVSEPEHIGEALAFRGRVLLLLDGVDQRAEEIAAPLAGWLAAAPESAMLVTSRRALGRSGEVLLEVPPLALPDRRRGALRSEATRLFRARARETLGAALPAEAGTDAVVADVVELLDGVPLAIELAAAQLALVSLDELCARLRAHREREQTPEGLEHGALLTALEESFGALDAVEVSVLTQCAVFEAPFTVEAAEETVALPEGCAEGVVSLLGRLRHKSWIASVRDDETGVRLAIYEPMRSFARRRADPEARAGAEARATGYLTDWVGHRLAAYELAGELHAARQILQTAPDLTAIARRALSASAPDPLESLRALSGLSALRCNVGLAPWPSGLEDLIEGLLEGDPPPLVAGPAHHLRGLLMDASARGRGSALADFERAFAHAVTSGDQRLAVLASRHAFSCCMRAGEPDAARRWADEASRRDVGPDGGRGGQDCLAVLELDIGSPERAVELGLVASEHTPFVQCPYQRFSAAARLVFVLLETGHVDEAGAWLDDLAARATGIGGTTEMFVERFRGIEAAERRSWGEARQRFEAAIQRARRAGRGRYADRWFHHLCAARWATAELDGLDAAIREVRGRLTSESERIYFARLTAFSGLVAARAGKQASAERELARLEELTEVIRSEDAAAGLRILAALLRVELGHEGADTEDARGPARRGGALSRSHIARTYARLAGE